MNRHSKGKQLLFFKTGSQGEATLYVHKGTACFSPLKEDFVPLGENNLSSYT